MSNFFYKKSFLNFCLIPLGLLLFLITLTRRKFIKPYKAKISVICCGNITLGGTGKTPTSLWIGETLQKQGKKVIYLTRGWRGKEKGPLLVNPQKHNATLVGDEALLLAAKAPTIVSKNRKEGAKLAEKLNMDIIIMDDGFQNPYIHKDFSCLIFDGRNGLGNTYLFPAGPLRETLKSGMAIADCALLLGKDSTHLEDIIKKTNPAFPIFKGKIDCTQPCTLNNKKPYMAFAGIGFPEKFFYTLKKHGFHLIKTKSFPDHHSYTSSDIENLRREAANLNAQLITTEKDFVKLSPVNKKYITPFPVKLTLEKNTDFIRFLENFILHNNKL